ncbi:MATE family efflux transporter [Anaerofustis sp. NSJ-163]|uniref:MATE family efflux transporter n=1 Tax=Anaerofustis sp. NSJ-163 TaxID=2944391 RepID=UPI00209BD5EA|nr:MATE family efflux transporter [Anaerofustis sp. NSJ-163]MCO8194105.1 MATE family efflux transporter [Anaerofustis sp. NSJ-163]
MIFSTKKIDTKDFLFSNKALMILIVPLIVEQFLAILVGMADSIMIASVGEAAVSGVSLVDSVMILLINIFAALATGGAVVCGQYLGKRDRENACESSTQLVWFITILAVFIMIFMYILKQFILTKVFGSIDAEVMGHANTYLLIVSASIPFIALYNAGAAIFRSMGNSKVSMKVSMLMNLINVCGNAILIYIFHFGTAGVAIPTLVSRIVAAVVIVVLLLNKNNTLYIKRSFKYKPRFDMIKSILYIGVPNGLENSMFQLGKIIVLSLVSTFGTYAIAANAVANVVASFQILSGMAVSLAITTVISRCVGAGEYKQARYYTRKLLKITYVCVAILVLFIFLILPLILKAYNLSDITALEASKILILHGCCAIIIWPTAFNIPSALRAAGDVKYCMIVSIVSMWVCRIIFSYILGKYMGFGVFGVWIAMILDWVVRSIFFIIRYRGSKWENKQVV